MYSDYGIIGQNDVYNVMPGTPPGLAGPLSMVGSLYGQVAGRDLHPYIPQNMAAYDAHVAKYYNTPIRSGVVSLAQQQFGVALGHTLGNVRGVDGIGQLLGMPQGGLKSKMADVGGNLSGGMIGGMLLPAADRLIAQLGLSGGSFLEAADTALAQRMNLLSASTMFTPTDGNAARQSMAATSSMLTLVNGLINRSNPDGTQSIMPNIAFTQGFDRNVITDILMKAAGAGAFSGDVSGQLHRGRLGYADRLQLAAGDPEIDRLTMQDLRGEGTATQTRATELKRFTRDFADTSKSLVEAVGAMRDMLKTTDGLTEKLTALTNGDWMRSGTLANNARNAVRKLHAVSQVYNMDPNQTMNMVMSNRTVMQEAAGINESMRFMGFDGGGMFSLEAQTEFIASIEDMVKRRGFQHDPILAARLRRQGLQLTAHNMNTDAGVATQALAWGRQLGVISDTEAAQYAMQLTSGDRAEMGNGIDRLLTTLFGSKEAGRQKLNDVTFVTEMRQAMNGDAGAFAMANTLAGADREYARRDQIAAADSRLSAVRSFMASSGISTEVYDEEAAKQLESVVNELGGTFSDEAKAFRGVYNRYVDSMGGAGALSMAVSYAKNDPTLSRYSERISLAMNRQEASTKEGVLREDGGVSARAKAGVDSLLSAGVLSGAEASELHSMIYNGDKDEALRRVAASAAESEYGTRVMAEKAMSAAQERYETQLNDLSDKAMAESLLSDASRNKYGSHALSDAFGKVASAARKFYGTKREESDVIDLERAFAQSGIGGILGEEGFNELRQKLRGGDADALRQIGRVSLQLRQVAASTLKGSGYGNEMIGMWGGGGWAGNVDEHYLGMADRINKVARDIQDTSETGAEARMPTIQRFLTAAQSGDLGDLFGAIKEEGDSSPLKETGKAFAAYANATSNFNITTRKMEELYAALNAKGEYTKAAHLRKQLYSGKNLTSEDISAVVSDLDLGSIGLGGYAGALVGALDARQQQQRARQDLEHKTIKELSTKEGMDKYLSSYRRQEFEKQEYSRRNGDFSFLDRIDVRSNDELEDAGLSTRSSEVEKARNRAYERMKEVVTDDEVKKALGVESLDSVSEAQVLRTRLGIVKQQAANNSVKHQVVAEQVKSAETAGMQRVYGEITIQDGKDSRPAVLSMSIDQ